jgi:hypothetical protein
MHRSNQDSLSDIGFLRGFDRNTYIYIYIVSEDDLTYIVWFECSDPVRQTDHTPVFMFDDDTKRKHFFFVFHTGVAQ